ncbi:MAG: CAP domain-containing protein [Chloroflexota bacterium]
MKNWVQLIWALGILVAGVVACAPLALPERETAVYITRIATNTPTAAATETDRLVVTVIATPAAIASATATPSATATAVPPTETPTPIPATETPAPSPTPTPTPALSEAPDWLLHFNSLRHAAQLAPVAEDGPLSAAALAHSEYMVRNDDARARGQRRDNPFYNEAGAKTAVRANIYAIQNNQANFVNAFNFWLSAPFHAVGLLDPQLETVGYGNFRDDTGAVPVTAVLDVETGLTDQPAAYPIYYPPDGGETYVLRQTLLEYPDPLSHCPGYQKPVGAPLILQIGDGAKTPQVERFGLWSEGVGLDVCLFHEGNYQNDNPHAQERGRRLLDMRDAIVLIPQKSLGVGQQYTAEVVANGETYRWSFTAVSPPPLPDTPIEPTDEVVAWRNLNIGGLEYGGQTHDLHHPHLMHQAGMRWVKFQQKWRSDSKPEELVERIRLARANEFKVLFALTGDPYPTQIDFAAYIEFMRGVAALPDPPDAVEVWNEMNIDFEWPVGEIDPNQYVNEMLRPVYEAIKTTNPNIMVISGAPAPTGFDNGTHAWASLRYFQGLAAAGITLYADCIGVHYNAGATSPYATDGHPAGAYFDWYLQPSLQSTYVALGGKRPLCITELGYLSGAGYPELPANFWWANQTTNEQQAQWLAEALTAVNDLGYVRLAIVFNVDIHHWGADPQGGYAILRPGGDCPFCRLIAGEP